MHVTWSGEDDESQQVSQATEHDEDGGQDTLDQPLPVGQNLKP
jgi:hypothetical protein